MTDRAEDLTLQELRDRIKVAGIQIPEARLEMVRQLLANALRPIRAMDTRALKTVEPAVTFDADPAGGTGRGK